MVVWWGAKIATVSNLALILEQETSFLTKSCLKSEMTIWGNVQWSSEMEAYLNPGNVYLKYHKEII